MKVGILDLHLLRRHAPSELDDAALAPDRIGGPVQDAARGHAPGEVAVNIDVLTVDDGADAHLGAGGLGALVDAAAGRDVPYARPGCPE